MLWIEREISDVVVTGMSWMTLLLHRNTWATFILLLHRTAWATFLLLMAIRTLPVRIANLVDKK